MHAMRRRSSARDAFDAGTLPLHRRTQRPRSVACAFGSTRCRLFTRFALGLALRLHVGIGRELTGIGIAVEGSSRRVGADDALDSGGSLLGVVAILRRSHLVLGRGIVDGCVVDGLGT